jgi:hypothetical protein
MVIGLRQLVSAWFQVLLTPLEAVLFTFQSPYFSTIGYQGVLSLGGWSPRFRTEFHELRATLVPGRRGLTLHIRDFHPLWWDFPDPSVTLTFVTYMCPGPQPRTEVRFGLIPFRSPLLGKSMSLSFPPGTKMFQFPGLPLPAYAFNRQSSGTVARLLGVSPFGHPGINAYLTATPGLSQPITSFIGSWHQGIHHAPLVT